MTVYLVNQKNTTKLNLYSLTDLANLFGFSNLQSLAKASGLSTTTLYRRCIKPENFSIVEVEKLRKAFNYKVSFTLK